MKALQSIGYRKAIKYLVFTAFYVVYRALPLPPMRAVFLRLLGAKIGKNCVIHNVRFFNYYRAGFKALTLGDECFLGDETLLDLASPITLEDQVTLSERVLILTHMNVGYPDHPLQGSFPSTANPVVIKSGSFVGANVTILNGVTIGPDSFIAAGALVNRDVPPFALVGGVPAQALRSLDAVKIRRGQNG